MRHSLARTIRCYTYSQVLAGSEEARIREFGHDKLSTYGLLANEGFQPFDCGLIN